MYYPTNRNIKSEIALLNYFCKDLKSTLIQLFWYGKVYMLYLLLIH